MSNEPTGENAGSAGDGLEADGLLRIATAPLALPIGLRDLLPPRSTQRRALARATLEHFAAYGYELVVPPAFEREAVLSLGLDEASRRGLVRFLEPESGEVMVLRPDMTPQIARIVATRLRGAPGVLRLMYEGSVVRTPRGRARRHRQRAQAGLECVGWASVAADAEVVAATVGALDALGLSGARVELAHAGLASALLALAPSTARDAAAEALGARDGATLERLLGARSPATRPLLDALALGNDAAVLERAASLRTVPGAAAALDELRALRAALDELGLGARVLIDVAAARGLGYYTGASFVLLAPGVGEPLGGGGRYDTLLERYGAPAPATGAALDLEQVELALERAGERSEREPTPPRVLLGGPSLAARAPHARALRAQGAQVAEVDAAGPEALAALLAASGRRGAPYTSALYCADGGASPAPVSAAPSE